MIGVVKESAVLARIVLTGGLVLMLASCGQDSAAGAATLSTVTVVPSQAASTPEPAPTWTPVPTPTPSPTPTPTPTPASSASTGKPVLVAEGDSISIFWAGNYTGIFAATHPKIDVRGTAVGGARITAGGSGNGLVQRAASDLSLKPTWVTVLIGANDLGDGTYPSAQGWLNALWAYVATIKASGVKVAVGTVLPICQPQNSTYTNTHAARRLIANAAIREAVGSRIDAVIDFAADPDIGSDSAACDRRWYKDGLHPTDGDTKLQGGQGRMAAIYTAVMAPLVK